MGKIILSEIPTIPPSGLDKDKVKKKVKKLAKKIGDLQHIMYAEKKHSLLVVLQGMDSSGKDGTTRNVFQYCNPAGIDAYGFKKPTEEEFAHDFLWRCNKLAPRKGNVMVFIRSHYEDILIQKVHNWIDDEKRERRMKAINTWEELLEFDNNTTVLKFYLHLSKERQEEKLQERIDIPEKNWKHNPGDWEERKHWDAYMQAYEDVLNWSEIPWHVIPVDQRWYRDYLMTDIMLKTMEGLNMKWPPLEQ